MNTTTTSSRTRKRSKHASNKGLKLAGQPIAIIRLGGEWRPLIRSIHRFEDDPEIAHVGKLEDLREPQRRKVQRWINVLEPATPNARGRIEA